MHPDDRERVLQMVRDVHHVIGVSMARLRARIDEGDEDEVPEVDVKSAQGLLAPEKTATGMIDAHPDLHDFVRQGGGEVAPKDDLQAILQAMKPPASEAERT